MTNYSGKFVSPVSHKTADEQKNVEVEASTTKFTGGEIPPAPQPDNNPSSQRMELVRSLFGKLWWLWLVVIFLWLTKED